jgi:HEAT repeats
MWVGLRSTLGASIVTAVLPLWATQAPAPQIQNGRVETRATTSIDQALSGISGPDPVWAFWRVPILDGERGPCSQWWYDGDREPIRGDVLDSGMTGTIVSSNRPQITPPTGPVPLEGGTGLLVLVRVVEGRVERLRTLGDDCPIDANGRTVYSLTGVTPSESLRYLDAFTRQQVANDRLSANARRSLAETALRAIQKHRDAGAETILDRIATSDNDTDLRRQAASALAVSRGAHGFATVKRLVDTEKNPDLRRSLVTSLGQTREPGTVEALRALTRDTDPKIRAEAVYYFAQRGGAAVVPEVRALVDKETDQNVKQRAVRGLARLPVNDAVPLLIQLARTSTDPVVRKESVSSLGQTRDPRAMAFLEELVKR